MSRENCPVERNCVYLILVHVISSNATKYATKWGKKDSIEQNRSSSLEMKCRIVKMEMAFDFVTGRQEIKLPFL